MNRIWHSNSLLKPFPLTPQVSVSNPDLSFLLPRCSPGDLWDRLSCALTLSTGWCELSQPLEMAAVCSGGKGNGRPLCPSVRERTDYCESSLSERGGCCGRNGADTARKDLQFCDVSLWGSTAQKKGRMQGPPRVRPGAGTVSSQKGPLEDLTYRNLKGWERRSLSYTEEMDLCGNFTQTEKSFVWYSEKQGNYRFYKL